MKVTPLNYEESVIVQKRHHNADRQDPHSTYTLTRLYGIYYIKKHKTSK
jgi:hypothetical protein